MVELDKKYNPQNTGTELDEILVQSLPLPIYDAVKLIDNQNDYAKSLQVLCLSLIPWTYQYIALILSGEYLASGNEPSFEVTDSLVNMVKKPGPGKWIGFTREAVKYFMDNQPCVISHDAISILNNVLNEKSKPQVKLFENNNKLEYSDALINIRNRFAHSRNFSAEKTEELFQDYYLIWKAWIIIIRDIFESRLIYRSTPANSYQTFDNRPFILKNISSDQDKNTTLLVDEKRETFIRLYPIIVTNSEDSKPNGVVAFLEEIKSKYLFYLQGDNFFKLKNEFDVLAKMIESKTIIEEEVTAESLTIKAFAERIDRITNQTISDFKDSMKYIPEMYIDRPVITINLDKWVESNLPGCILAGNPGTGKTSIITNWCIWRKSKGDHVLLLEASRFRESDITMIIEKELNLASTLKDCLDTIQKQNKNSEGEQDHQRFIIVIDAVNEFTGKDNENRSRLWREINSLVSSLNLYSPYLKCLVTTRSDLWEVDFPGKNTASDMLKEKLFWGEAVDDFPKLLIGDFTMEEASEIFENARRTIPSMAVQNSFSKLSGRTKKVLCNPFIMRLALLTFNGREMPGLTKSKIENLYTREKITEEKDKKAVLFALLERMSELRKTEITFDEFLYAESKIKSKKKVSEKDKKNLEKLIFDPRPQSPYKKLIKEGILEERSDDSNIESKEIIKFSQEKITDIIYSEFKKRSVTKVLKLAGIAFLIYLGFFIFEVFTDEKSAKNQVEDIRKELNNSSLAQKPIVEISSISSGIIKRTTRSGIIINGFVKLLIFTCLFGYLIFGLNFRLFVSKQIKNDLSTRFIKEKFVMLVQKKILYIFIPIIIFAILYSVWLSSKSDMTPSELLNSFMYVFPIMMLSIILWILGLHAIIVLKNGNSPQDAFTVFGKKETIHSGVEMIPIIPLLLLVYFGLPKLPELLENFKDEKLISLQQDWDSNLSVKNLNQQNPAIYSSIIKKLPGSKKDNKKDIKPFLVSMSKIMVFSFLNAILFSMVFQYFAGFWLFKILKRRL